MQLENIGKWKVFAIDSGFFKLDGGAMMGSVPKVLWEKGSEILTSEGSHDSTSIFSKGFLKETPEKELIDNWTYYLWDEKDTVFTFINKIPAESNGLYSVQLKVTDSGNKLKFWKREDIDDLLITVFMDTTVQRHFPETKIIIGNDVLIGEDVLITKNVQIGNGAVIAAKSVLIHDVPPYAIVIGNPATIVSYRYSKKEIEMIEKIKWWNWSTKKIIENIHIFKMTRSELNNELERIIKEI